MSAHSICLCLCMCFFREHARLRFLLRFLVRVRVRIRVIVIVRVLVLVFGCLCGICHGYANACAIFSSCFRRAVHVPACDYPLAPLQWSSVIPCFLSLSLCRMLDRESKCFSLKASTACYFSVSPAPQSRSW